MSFCIDVWGKRRCSRLKITVWTDAYAAVCVTVAADERRADVVARLAHEAVGMCQRRLNQGEEFTINKRVEVGTATFDDALKTPTRV